MKDKNTKRVFKIFMPWEVEKEENWLREMANTGWHLSVTIPYFYYFSKGEPKDIIYRLDYKMPNEPDKGEYISLLKECNWEFICEMSNWYYFRTDMSKGEFHDLFSDNTSKIKRYKSVLKVLLFLLLPLTTFLPNEIRTVLNFQSSDYSIFIISLIGFAILCYFLLIYIDIRLFLYIKKLEKNIKQ